MKIVPVLLLALVLPACATLGFGGGGGERRQLWEQAHAAYSADSFRESATLFQRLFNEHPGTHEGHEARFFVGMLSVEPRSNVDLRIAEQQLLIYLAEDTLKGMDGIHLREAGTVLALVRELQKPCDARVPGLPCMVQVAPRETPDEPAPPPSTAAPAEIARLRREIAERDGIIRDLREELQRIRNTVAPRRPRD